MPAIVLLAVDAATASLTADDRLFADALVAGGAAAVPVVWGEPVPPRSTVVVRSTWDYVEAPAAFLAWLDVLDADDVVVHNATSLLRWNVHKGYLVDLARRGVPVVPTVVVPRGCGVDLGEVMRDNGWDDAVVKPAIGGTARLARHVGSNGCDAAQRHLDDLVAAEDALVQQFVVSVPSAGEVSVIAIGGVVTHAVRKRAAVGDWRVQAEFGGTAEVIEVTSDLAVAADAAVAAIAPTPLYARVDLVEAATGAWQLMELELVEPELFFRLAPDAATHAAELVVRAGRR